MRRVAVGSHGSRGRLAYDPLDPDCGLWCQHGGAPNGSHRRVEPPGLVGLRMFALDSGEPVRLRYVDDGEYYVMRGDHPHALDDLLQHVTCMVCGARIDLRCTVEMARQER